MQAEQHDEEFPYRVTQIQSLLQVTNLSYLEREASFTFFCVVRLSLERQDL